MGQWVKLLSGYYRAAVARLTSRGALTTLGTAVAADFLNLDFFRQTGIAIAPGSEGAALEEVARTIMRMLNLSGEEMLWPRHNKGPTQGEPIVPMYAVIDLSKGRGWFMGKYNSFNTVQAAFKRGQRRGFGSGKRTGLRETQAYARG